MSGADYSPERIAAREQIRDALHWYCRAIDRSQHQWLRKAFHQGGIIHSGAFDGDIADYPAWLAKRHVKVAKAVHIIGNILFDFLDEAHAFVEAYCLAIEEFKAEGVQPALNRAVRLRYADVFEKRSGVWKIVERGIVIDHVMAPQPVAEGGFFAAPLGARDLTDPVLQQRASLGLHD